MKKSEILKILEKVDGMRSIRKVKIKSEGFEISVEKSSATPQPMRPPIEAYSSDTNPKPKGAPGMASPFQVKYARDLMGKVFTENERQSSDFLAHILEIPMDEVPDINTWDETLTVDMVSAIIDGLQPMHKTKGRSEF